MGAFIALIRKDLRLELRAGESVLTLVVLSLLILVVMVFALNAGVGPNNAETAAGALWVALIFAGTMGATRTLLAERENGCIRALMLSPTDPATLFFAKLTAGFLFMMTAEIAAVVLLVLFFNLDFDIRVARLAPPLMLGALGFAALATLLAGISGRVRTGDLLLPLLAVPMFVPALIAGVKASAIALTGSPLSSAAQWLKILTAFDMLFLGAGYLLFEFVMGED
ncbi:MAG TPA: heme exporter protein CcmB [Candidatus Binataceae bacterium]|nr:heme exporter protein CcmB [Candidatus Binataceae bacterium]